MDKNKIIIFVLVAIVIVLLAGIFAVMPNLHKKDTNLTFITNDTINEGDSIEIQLTDGNGTPLVNQTVNITITDENKTSDYHSVITNDDGMGTLNPDKNAGNYSILVSYGGNEKYNEISIAQNLTIKKVETTTTSTSSSLPYSIDNLPPSNDPYPEVRRYQVNEYTVVQEYADHYRSNVDLRTGERNGGFF